MKRFACVLALVAVVASAQAALAQESLESLVLSPPRGFALTPGGINGPMTADDFASFAPDAVDEFRQMEKDKVIEGFGRVMQNRATQTVIVIFLFRTRATAVAEDLYKGIGEGAESSKTFKPAIPDAIGFVDTAEGTTVYGIGFRRARFAAIVVVLGRDANERTVNGYASQQRARLPDDPGDAAYNTGYKIGQTIRDWLWAIGLGFLAFIVLVVVLIRRKRREREAMAGVPGAAIPGAPIPAAPPPAYDRPSGGVCRNGHPIPKGQFFCTTCGAPAMTEEQQPS